MDLRDMIVMDTSTNRVVDLRTILAVQPLEFRFVETKNLFCLRFQLCTGSHLTCYFGTLATLASTQDL